MPTLTSTSDYDVIIIGGGVIGTTLGVALGQQGRRTLVLERDLREPDRFIGELLQPGGYRALQKLGLERKHKEREAYRNILTLLFRLYRGY
jgi:squalene monooxygenase